jgi:ribosomal protein S18 acetylase RimI-like enzyme
MQFCIDLARGTGSEWIWLVVWYQNHTAIRFYERWGFESFAYFDFKFGHEIHRDHVMRLRVLPTE